MFRTKKDVDRHSQEVLQKITNEKDRNLRCLSIAQLYYNVQDYESAKRYILTYLSVKDESSLAHKLLGQCYEQFDDKPKALQEYIRSLQVDSKQPELVLKVCELICENEIFDKSQAKHWFSIGEKQFPYHPAILKLKNKLFLLNDNNYTSLETSLTEQIKSKPNDPGLHTQLLTFYAENGRIREAYEEAFKKPRHFTPIIQWYQCAVKICKMYKVQFPNALQEDFYANNLLSLERLLALAVQDVKLSRKSITECVSFLARFDETLSDAVLLVNKSAKFQKIINHMCGQLCFHAASIIYRKLKWENIKSPQELNQLIAPLLLLSTSKEFKIVEDRTINDSLYRTYNICVIQNAYRILQAEFVLHGMAQGNPKEFIEKIFHLCVGDFWKERISEKIYSTSDYSKFRKSSFFMTYASFSNLPTELPSQILENVEKKINITETVNPISLHHLVWLGVNYLMLSDKKSLCDMYLSYQFYARKFSALPFCSTSTTPYAESLCRLDVDAFLYASVFCAKSFIDQQMSSDKYHIFLADVSKLMCSAEQENWWEYAYQMCSKTTPDSGIASCRSTLQRGIEAVRLSGSSSLPLPLLILLARTFSSRGAVESDSDKASALEERAVLYWKAALPLLDNIARNQTISATPKSIFEYHGNVITKAIAVTLIEEGKRIVGMHLIKSNDYNEDVEHVNESYGDLNTSTVSSNAGVGMAATLWGDKIIQSMLEQNAKITDKMETLFNKQELLCSNQFQLLEMISALTKKVEALILPDYDEYLDKLAATQATVPVTPSAANISAGFPSSLASSWTPAPASYLQQQLQTPHMLAGSTFNTPKTPNNLATITYLQNPAMNPQSFVGNGSITPRTAATASFMQKHPHLNATPTAYPMGVAGSGFMGSSPHTNFGNLSLSGGQSISEIQSQTSMSSKLEPAYGAVSGYLTSLQQQQQTPIASNVLHGNLDPSNSLQSSVHTGFMKVTQTPQFIPTTAAENTVGGHNWSFTGSNSLTSAKTPSTISGTPPTSTATPTRPSYHIPMPDISSIIQPSPPIQVPQDEDDDEDDVVPVEHDPIPDFKPIIPLPDEIVVQTGEEGEEVVYENRVRLFRFVDKEWKERGIGMYKLLKNPLTGRIRALMRREIVHKVCANHMLSEDTQLSQMKTSDRAWIYSAPDYADEKVKVEQFCIKFKTPDEAAKFHAVFNKYRDESVKAAKETKDSPKNATSVSVTPSPPTKPDDSPASVVTALTPKKTNDTSKFTPRSTSLFGSPAATVTPAASAATAVTTTAGKATGNESSTFVFSAPKLQASLTAPQTTAAVKAADTSTPDATKPSPFATFGGFTINALPKPTSTFSNLFQQQQSQSTSTKPKSSVGESTAAEPAPFSNVVNAIDFSKLSQTSGTAFSKSKDFKGFRGAGSLVFGGSAATGPKTSPVAAILKDILPQSPRLDASNVSPSFRADDSNVNESTVASTGGGGDEDEFVPTQEFSPVIPLPELIDVKTGEEGLQVLYEERCKLYRYTGDEWKERGVGNMKILRDPETGYVRLLMRREQVHKVCCNHRVLKEHEMKPHTTSEKAWTWCAQDFSENELKNETFCIRFKTVEMANAFRDAFNRAKSNLESPQKASSSDNTASSQKSGAKAELPKLSELFKPKVGSWECKECYVRNNDSDATCVSCATPRNPSEQKPAAEGKGAGESTFVDNKSKLGGGGNFTFGMPATKPDSVTTSTPAEPAKEFSFGSAAANPSSQATAPSFSFGSLSTFSFGNTSVDSSKGSTAGANSQSQNKTTFSFGPPAVSQAQPSSQNTSATNTSAGFTPIASTPQTGSKSLFSFGSAASSSPAPNIFNSPVIPVPESAPTGSDGPTKPLFSFPSTATSKPSENASIFGSGPISSPFSFGGKPQENVSIFDGTSTGKSSSNTSIFGSPESNKPANTSGAFNSFSFKLPKDLSISTVKVEPSSQESGSFYERIPLLINDKNEIRLFKSRATLYRCEEDKDEEECGHGKLYILKNPITCKVRLLFLKKPGLVACLSHFIDEKMTVELLDEFSWLWFASDFSKAEILDCIVRVVFDDAESASEFKRSLDDAQKEIKDNSSDSTASSEVEFVSELKSNDEDRKLAESLRLPSNFFAYKYQKDCPGCAGCDEEDRKRQKENKENQSMKSTQPSSLFSSTVPKTTSLFGAFSTQPNDPKPSSIFGDITNNTTWLGKSPFKLNEISNQSTEQSPSQKSGARDGSDDDDENVVKNDHDPYFEPIIPLPDIVEVKTGEESEEIKFCQRAKLFRYDDKDNQWKERGIGELKVLYHPFDKTYRLLLRREQVHKVVLNQRVTNSLTLQPVASSRTSWCWFGMNLPEQESEPVLEKLAAKFKTEALATSFYDVVQESLFDINTVQKYEFVDTDVETVTDVTEEPAASTSDVDDDDHEYGEGNYDDENYVYDREYEDGDDEYEPDYYVDEEGIGDAMEELVFENDVHVEVLEGNTSVDYDGVIKLLKKYDEDKEDDVGCIMFSTPEVHALYKADIVEGMNAINEGNGIVAFVELNSDEYEKKMSLQFANEEIAEDFAVSFRTLNIPASPRN